MSGSYGPDISRTSRNRLMKPISALMNIRNLSNPAQVLAKDKIDASKAIKSDNTDDRDANGQQSHSDTKPHRPLTDEEMGKVVEKLKSNDGIKKHGLEIQVSIENDVKIVKILTPEGQTIRRFIESELYFYLFKDGAEDLQLLRKSA